MLHKILTRWTFRRALYLLGGVFIIVQSILNSQWIGVVFGGYFTAMGLFAFGCAAGSCSVSAGKVVPPLISDDKIQHVEFEEVKTK